MSIFPILLFGLLLIANIRFVKGEWLKRTVSPSDPSYTGISWTGDGIVVAVGAKSSGTFLRSTDYGLTWTQVGTSLSPTSMYGVATSTSSGVTYTYAGDDQGKIYRSTDQGATWSYVNTLINAIYSVAVGSNGKVFFGGASRAITQGNTSSSSSFTTKALPGSSSSELIYGVSTIDGTNVITVSSGGRSHYSSNGGSSWTLSTAYYSTSLALSTTAGRSLYCVTMANRTIAYVGGASGAIYKTATGGVSWYQLTSPVSSDIRYQAISALDVNTVFIASNNGRLFASYNGGISWSQQLSLGTTSTGLTSVSMYTTEKGVAGGSSGFGIYALVPSKI